MLFPSYLFCACLGLLDCVGNLFGEFLHFGRFHFDVVMKVEVGLGLHGDEVDVSVGHFKA